jgi:hypothetical protein
MRVHVICVCGLLAACTSTYTVPDDPVMYEVPQGGTASSAGGDTFATTIEAALAEDPSAPAYAPPPPGSVAPLGTTPSTLPGAQVALQGSTDGTGNALNDDTINLMQWTLEQQKIDAAIAERELRAARDQLVVVQPGPLPNRPEGVNVALFAQQTTNAKGERAYERTAAARVASVGNCGRFRDADAAQRAFLAGGGPERDRYGLDPDGDGFACSWDPAPYRMLR